MLPILDLLACDLSVRLDILHPSKFDIWSLICWLSDFRRRDKKARTSSGSVPIAKRKGRPKGAITNPGKLSSDESPGSSGKPEEKATSKYNDDTPRTGSRLKKDTGNKSNDDTPKTGDKSKDETSKIDAESGDDNQMTGNKSTDDLPRSSRKSKDETPKTDSKSEDDMIGTGGKAKEAGKGKSSEETPRSWRKLKGSASRKTGDSSKANGTSGKGKSKVQEIETTAGKMHSDSAKAQENEASTGKKRKRRGQS